MDNLAQNYQPSIPASIAGLDDLFADASQKIEDATQCEAVASQFESDATQCEAVASHCEYTIIEASQALKVVPSTIYRRIKAGKYQTVIDANGIVKVLLPRNAGECEASATQCEIVAEPDARQCDAIANECEADASHCESQALTDNSSPVLLEMSRKLEAASYRIGWLESQLQEREKELKLLTDSQHKPSLWAKFTAWLKSTR